VDRYSAHGAAKGCQHLKTNKQPTKLRRFKMQVTKTLIALAVVAGFASSSFAQGTTTAPATPAAPTAKVVAPAPVAAEKKVEAPKATEVAKADTVKAAEPAKEGAKPVKHHHKKAAKKAEAAPAATPAPTK
jgi:hypothetical protein